MNIQGIHRLPNRLPLSILVLCIVLSGESKAEILNIRSAPYLAKGDGVSDDRPALAKVFAAAKPKDTILIPPGTYRMVLPGGPLKIPDEVTLWGQSGKSKFLLASNSDDSQHREFLTPGNEVTMLGISIERAAEFPIIMLPIGGKVSEITFRNCQIDGNHDLFPNRYCHAIRVGSGTLRNLILDGVTIKSCTYGLFQPNDSTGTVDGIRVENCRFFQNTATDLEFNSPKGVMKNIVVKDCFFRNNLCNSPSGGFAVGFANVNTGVVQSSVIQNYRSEALHVEDRSTNIILEGNTITNGSYRQPNGVILVINDSNNVLIKSNHLDARKNSNKPHLILVTAGGDTFSNPSDVSVIDNILVNGPATRTWYLQKGSGPSPQGNLILSAPQDSNTD